MGQMRMKLVLASEEDPAGRNIVGRLLEFFDFERAPDHPGVYVCGEVFLSTIQSGVTRLNKLPFVAEEVIVASRHASESGKPTLTVHAPGEVEKQELAIAAPETIKAALKALVDARDELKLPYEVSLEATHHGPTKLIVPVTFVEVGSSYQQWQDTKAAEAVAHAIMGAATNPVKGRRAIGFGGPHYAPRHTEIVLRTDVCIGHILPKYVEVNETLVEKAMRATDGGVELFALDWKGLDADARTKILNLATKFGVRAARGHELLK